MWLQPRVFRVYGQTSPLHASRREGPKIAQDEAQRILGMSSNRISPPRRGGLNPGNKQHRRVAQVRAPTDRSSSVGWRSRL